MSKLPGAALDLIEYAIERGLEARISKHSTGGITVEIKHSFETIRHCTEGSLLEQFVRAESIIVSYSKSVRSNRWRRYYARKYMLLDEGRDLKTASHIMIAVDMMVDDAKRHAERDAERQEKELASADA